MNICPFNIKDKFWLRAVIQVGKVKLPLALIDIGLNWLNTPDF